MWIVYNITIIEIEGDKTTQIQPTSCRDGVPKNS